LAGGASGKPPNTKGYSSDEPIETAPKTAGNIRQIDLANMPSLEFPESKQYREPVGTDEFYSSDDDNEEEVTVETGGSWVHDSWIPSLTNTASHVRHPVGSTDEYYSSEGEDASFVDPKRYSLSELEERIWTEVNGSDIEDTRVEVEGPDH